MGFVDLIQSHDAVFGNTPLWPVYLNHLRYQEWCDLSLHEDLWDLVASIFCDLHASKGDLESVQKAKGTLGVERGRGWEGAGAQKGQGGRRCVGSGGKHPL